MLYSFPAMFSCNLKYNIIKQFISHIPFTYLLVAPIILLLWYLKGFQYLVLKERESVVKYARMFTS